MLPHLLTDCAIRGFFQNEIKYEDVYSKNNLPRIKDEEYIINLDEPETIGARWIPLYVSGDNISYFDSFLIEYIQEEIKKIIGNKNITTNTYTIQAYDSIKCGNFCLGLIAFMMNSRILLDYTNLVSPNEYEKSNKMILKCFE